MASADGEPKRILVTGANGFVGRHLLAHLLSEDAPAAGREGQERPRITAAVHAERGASLRGGPPAAGWNGDTCGERVEVCALDLRDAAAVRALVQRARPREIYHLAARASGADADRDAIFAVNVAGTRHLLEAASELSPFPQALVVSTGYVYGATDPARPAREGDPVGPLWRFGPYTDSKIEMENVARGYRGFARIARPFAHTGPGQMPVYALPAFARQLARIERGLEPPVLRVGNLEARRDLLDVRDIARAYALFMAKGQPGEILNIATGKPLSMQCALDRLRALCAVPTEVVVDPARLRPADIACSTGDPLAFWAATGWQPHYALEETLRDTLDYWRKQ